MIRLHADRVAALAQAGATYRRELDRIDQEQRRAHEKATRLLHDEQRELAAVPVALQAEHAAAIDAELTPILATFNRDGGSREMARKLIAVCQARDALVLAELGTEPKLGWWLALAFCRAEVAADLSAALALGAADAWACGANGFGDEAHIAATAVRNGDVLVTLAALERLEAAVHKAAIKLPRDPRNAGRLDAVARCVVNIEPLEQHDRDAHKADDARLTREREAERDLIRRYRAGDVGAADGQPPGWTQSVLALGEDLFGRLHSKFDGVRRADAPNDAPPTMPGNMLKT